jgi:hypothetical protein
MDTDLVRSTRMDLKPHPGKHAKIFQHFIICF